MLFGYIYYREFIVVQYFDALKLRDKSQWLYKGNPGGIML